MYLYGLSQEWSAKERLGCGWDDENVNISWPIEQPPSLSPRDANPKGYQEMVAGFEEAILSENLT